MILWFRIYKLLYNETANLQPDCADWFSFSINIYATSSDLLILLIRWALAQPDCSGRTTLKKRSSHLMRVMAFGTQWMSFFLGINFTTLQILAFTPLFCTWEVILHFHPPQIIFFPAWVNFTLGKLLSIMSKFLAGLYSCRTPRERNTCCTHKKCPGTYLKISP